MTKFEGEPSIWRLKVGWGGFQLRDAVSRRRCEIKLRWQLIINRKSYMGFRLHQKSMTLNDLKWPWTREQRSAIVSCTGIDIHVWLLRCWLSITDVCMCACGRYWVWSANNQQPDCHLLQHDHRVGTVLSVRVVHTHYQPAMGALLQRVEHLLSVCRIFIDVNAQIIKSVGVCNLTWVNEFVSRGDELSWRLCASRNLPPISVTYKCCDVFCICRWFLGNGSIFRTLPLRKTNHSASHIHIAQSLPNMTIAHVCNEHIMHTRPQYL